jgi:hypothetical protein
MRDSIGVRVVVGRADGTGDGKIMGGAGTLGAGLAALGGAEAGGDVGAGGGAALRGRGVGAAERAANGGGAPDGATGGGDHRAAGGGRGSEPAGGGADARSGAGLPAGRALPRTRGGAWTTVPPLSGGIGAGLDEVPGSGRASRTGGGNAGTGVGASRGGSEGVLACGEGAAGAPVRADGCSAGIFTVWFGPPPSPFTRASRARAGARAGCSCPLQAAFWYLDQDARASGRFGRPQIPGARPTGQAGNGIPAALRESGPPTDPTDLRLRMRAAALRRRHWSRAAHQASGTDARARA